MHRTVPGSHSVCSRSRAAEMLVLALAFMAAGCEPGPTATRLEGLGTESPSAPTAYRSQAVIQGLFMDTFDSGALIVSQSPPGVWDVLATQPGVTVQTHTEAARRGSAGLRVVDAHDATTSGPEGYVKHERGASDQFYIRYWIRLNSHNGVGWFTFHQTLSDRTTGKTLQEVTNYQVDPRLGVAGFHGADIYKSDDPTSAALVVGQWHLVEHAITGIGTTSGLRRLWIDGELRAQSGTLDFSARGLQSESLGIPLSGDRRFQGTVDFDDYRSNMAPLASRFHVSAPTSNTAGSCTEVTVSLRDTVTETDAPAPYALDASLTAAGGGSFYTESTCSTPARAVSFATGDSSRIVYFRSTLAGTTNLSASHVDFLTGTANISTAAGPAHHVAFVNTAHGVVAGHCSPALTVRVEDAFGNPTETVSPSSAPLTSSGTSTAFFSDPLCATAASSVELSTGTGNFFVQDTLAGTPTLTVSPPGLIHAEQVLTVGAAPATQLAFLSPPTTAVAGTCSAALTLQSQDAYGNVSPVTNDRAVSLESSSPNATFYVDAACTTVFGSATVFPSGASTLSFYVQDTLAGTPELTAEGPEWTGRAKQTATVQPGPADALVLAGMPPEVAAATTVAFTVTAYDAFGNPATGFSGTLSFTSSDPSALLPAAYTFPGDVASKAFSVRFQTLGTQQLVVSDGAGAVALTSSAATNVTVGPPASLVFRSPPQTFAARTCSGAAAATMIGLRDGAGYEVVAPAGGIRFTMSSDSPGTVTWYRDASCTLVATDGAFIVPENASSVAVYFRDSATGTPTLGLHTDTGLSVAPGQMQNILPLPPRDVTSASAERTSPLTVVLHGSANPEGLAATAWFRYGKTHPGACDDSFGELLPTGGIPLESSEALVRFSHTLSGLQPSTTYYFCAVVSSADGTSFGNVSTFRTPGPPVVTSLQMEDVTFRGALLRGRVNPNGDTATGWFRYDTAHPGTCHDDFGIRVPDAGGEPLGDGTAEESFALHVSNLSPETTYYVCAFGSNFFGTEAGEVVSFFTPAAVAGPPSATSSRFALDEGDGASIVSFAGTVSATVTLFDVQGLIVPLGASDVLTLEVDAPLVKGAWTVRSDDKRYVSQVQLPGCTDAKALVLRARLNGVEVGTPLWVQPVCAAPQAEVRLALAGEGEQKAPVGGVLRFSVTITDHRPLRTPLHLVSENRGLRLRDFVWSDHAPGPQALEHRRIAVPEISGENPRQATMDAWVLDEAESDTVARAWLETGDGLIVSETSEDSVTVVRHSVDFGCGCAQGGSSGWLGLLAVWLAAAARRPRHHLRSKSPPAPSR